MKYLSFRFGVAAFLATIVASYPGLAAAQSTTLSDYALFAERGFRTKGLTLSCGNVGVNRDGGKLIAPRYLTAPAEVVADIVKLSDESSVGQLYANLLLRGTGVSPLPWTPPILATDIQTECGFPVPFPVCDASAPVTVTAGDTLSLPPGTYGEIKVKGGFDELGVPTPGTLELTGGNYTFCGVKLGKFGEVRFQGPSTVHVATNLKMQANNYWGPATGSGLGPDDITVYVAGSKVHYSRGSSVSAELCAPAAKCRLTKAGSHAGAVYCRDIRTEEITFVCTAGTGSPSGAFLD